MNIDNYSVLNISHDIFATNSTTYIFIYLHKNKKYGRLDIYLL